MTQVKLKINGEEIPLNPIMSKVLTNINLGFIETLKGIPEKKENISIVLEL